MPITQPAPWQVFDAAGRRKYLNADERRRFLAAADRLAPERKALCYLLAYTGCRVSEALALRADQLDDQPAAVRFRTLKRRKLVYRSVPIPDKVLRQLRSLPATPDGQLWHMHRVTAWRCVREITDSVAIAGPMACCRGLRHGFGIHAVSTNVPPNLIQRWMGHASGTTTAIYLDAVGFEEQQFASRMWH
ncbi:MAG: site-specific integrase [Pseudomonadota bacterium]